ncbi:MAG: SRPBCC family protein [bacterium]
MDKGFVAKASITLDAPAADVWKALTDPSMIKQYFFGTDVASDWKPGSPIVFRGEWQGKGYEDKGVILEAEPERLLKYTHSSNLSGLPDTPENYHTVTITLVGQGPRTVVSLSQDNNRTEQARDHSQKNWESILASLKKLLED